MQKKFFAVLAVVAVVALAVSLAWASQTKSGEAADVMQLQDKVFPKATKGPVTFSHLKHYADYKIACDQCHHVIKDGKNVWKEGDKVEACGTCHKSPKKDEGKMLSAYNAYHKNCKDCHKEAKKGPTKCNDCHPKK
ncbi:MAG: cytochrome c family protein [Deltaproteobacteria bacterium]|nr:cytochrome c family protein [Deltaproteobacteria bacterium]